MDDDFNTVVLNARTLLFLEVSDRAPDELRPEEMTSAEILRCPHVRVYSDQAKAHAAYFDDEAEALDGPNEVA